jgi:hypothetical protein
MRNISFALTTEQVRSRTKTVTRRLGWRALKPGTLLQPVVKAQGLKKGEHVEKIGGPIRVLSVDREPLTELMDDEPYGCAEVVAEGFPDFSPEEFISMFARSHGCSGAAFVTRIAFEYVEEERKPMPEIKSREGWIWFGYAGHLAVGKHCAYHLSTLVAGGTYLVSTAGHYLPKGRDTMDTIGSGPGDYFETMVFKADGIEPGGDARILDWSAVETVRYEKSLEAEHGHYAACERWHARVS